MTRPLHPEPTGAYLRPLLGVDFTEAQLAIATHELAPQQVIAGAGSGKTMVMAARVVHAVAIQGVGPSAVLGLTFTNKAAGELATRVRRSLFTLVNAGLLPSPGDGVSAVDELPTVSTYHAYAATIVRDHALRIGREPVTTLLTEAARWQLATQVVRAAGGPFEHLPWTTPTVADRILSLAGEMAEHLVEPGAVRRTDAELITAVDGLAGRVLAASKEAAEVARTRDELLHLVEDYTAAKRRLDLLDFGDQVALAARIAAVAPVVGALERSRFGLVVLDEYQDTGVAQRILLSELFGAGHPVVAVGDPNQAIYGWRGASVGNLLRFADHFPRGDEQPIEPQPLMVSFRCGGRILRAANTIAAGIGAGNPRRPRLDVPPLSPPPGREDDGQVLLARTPTDVEEAGWIADRLADEAARGTPPGEMAVLVRRTSDFPRLHRALVEAGLPVEVVGLGGLLQMPEVADVVAVLSVLDDPAANAAAIRVLCGPRWRFGLRDLAALGRRAGTLAAWTVEPVDETEPDVSGGLDAALSAVTAQVDPVDVASLLDAIHSPGPPDRYSPAAVERLARLRAELHDLAGLVGAPLIELVTEVTRRIGLDIEIEAEPAPVAAARAANLAAFADQAARFAGLEGESDLSAFLAYLAAAEDAERGLDVGTVSAADTVKLMTVHKAKGLEWDVVALPSLIDKVFPSGRGRPLWTRNGEALPNPLRGDAGDLPRLAGVDKAGIDAFRSDSAAEAADEERRLAYVAVTRARRRLLASTHLWTASRKNPCPTSPFLLELAGMREPHVAVDLWCDDPGDGDIHPLAETAGSDVAWPAAPDAAALARRSAAADLVRTAMADPSVGDGDGAAVHIGGAAELSAHADLIVAELREQRTTVREVPLPRRLSASQVVMLAHDPGELARALARPTPARPVAQARRGSRFHAWVEGLWQAAPLLDTDDLPGATDAELTDEELGRLQERFAADGWTERRPVAVEQPFELVVAGRLLRGRIDAVYGVGAAGEISAVGDTSGGFDVIDYKTGRVPQDFAAASLQLSVYRLAWADIAGVDQSRVGAGFLYVRTGTLKRPDRLLDRDELAALLQGS